MITFLGTVVFTTIIGIGALDARSDLSLFASYRPAHLRRIGQARPRPRRRDDGDQSQPPAPGG